MTITVQLLVSPGCGHGARTLDLLRQLVPQVAPEATVEAVTVDTVADAERLAFPGSPTVRVNGTDIDSSAPCDVGLG